MGTMLIVFVGLVVNNSQGADARAASEAELSVRRLAPAPPACCYLLTPPLSVRLCRCATPAAANTPLRTALIVCVLLYNSYVFVQFAVTLLNEIQRVVMLETARDGNDHEVTDADRRTFVLRVWPNIAQRRGAPL